MTTICLGEAARFINGAAFKPTDWEDNGLPIIRIQNLTGTGERFNYTTRQVKPDLIVEPGDLLVSWSATLDVYRWNGARGVLNQHIFKVLPALNVDPDYLFYALKSVISELSAKTHGSTMKHVVRGDFESTRVLMPELDKQRRIVDILSRAEGIVRLRREAQKKAAEIIPSLFFDMFGDPAINPKGWPMKKIGEVCSVQTGSTPSRKNPAYYDGNIHWVKTAEISGSTITRTEEKISELALMESNCKVFPIGTILVAMYGQGQTRGRSAMLGIEAATNQACAAILPSDKIIGEFLFCFLQTQYEELRGLAHGGNQPNLNLSMVKTYQVVLPPVGLQSVFKERFEEVVAIQSQQSAATAKAEATFNALLAHTFSGQEL